MRPPEDGSRRWPILIGVVLGVSVLACGCTGPFQWIRNGFKVGPNYGTPPAPVADSWIDADNPKVRHVDRYSPAYRAACAGALTTHAVAPIAAIAALPLYSAAVAHAIPTDIAAWWCIFDDPILNDLVQRAYAENLTVREAAFRILEARAQVGIAVGEILPQTQTFTASYSRNEFSLTRSGVVPAGSGQAGVGLKRFFDSYTTAFNLAWELDFWGKFRRAVESANAVLDASIYDYDEVVVMLVSDVALNYVQYRTLQKRLELARENVREQVPLVAKMELREKASVKDSFPDYNQLKANLDATRALIPQLETSLRLVNNNLCILLGIPPRDLAPELGDGRVFDPATKANVVRIPRPRDEQLVLGIPGSLLLRRPDVMRAERLLAAQSAQIGIAEAEYYPHIVINGTIGLQSSKLSLLFNSLSWAGSIGPSLTWNIMNYGRILNNVRLQNAKFQELIATYQKTALIANQEAENALVGYLNALIRAKDLQGSADAASNASRYLYTQLRGEFGADTGQLINRVFTVQNFKVQQQDVAAQAEGDVPLNLILLYRALGGGWQIHQGAGCHPTPAGVLGTPQVLPPPKEVSEKEAPKGAVGPVLGPVLDSVHGNMPTLLPALTPASVEPINAMPRPRTDNSVEK